MTSVIIFNPHAGRGQAARRLRRMPLDRLGPHQLWPTAGSGHAGELAVRAARQGAETVIAAGGDGTVHEVANGLLTADRSGTALGIIPIGSANDYFHGIRAEAEFAPGTESLTVDVGRVRAPGRDERFFVCCLGLGLNGAVTLESRKIRGLQGIPLYGLATLRALRRREMDTPMSIAIDGELALTKPTLLLSALIAQREGGFLMAPNARLADGLFNYVHAGKLSRWDVVRLLPRIALFGAPQSYPQVEIGRCRHIAVKAATDLITHIDGEFFSTPKDQVRELDVDLLPKRLTIRLLPREFWR